MTSLEDRFWLTVICAVHQTRWSGARLFSGVSLRICPCFLLLAHRWPDAWEASGCKLSARPCSGSSGAAWRMCTRTISLGTGLSCFPDHSICSSKAICPVRECPLKTVSDRAIGHASAHRRSVVVTPGWNKAGHPLPCGRSSAILLTCVFSSQHFSSYPAFGHRCMNGYRTGWCATPTRSN